MKCICCKKNIKNIKCLDKGDSIYSSNFHNASSFNLICSYGSIYDGEIYQGVICDSCLKESIKDKSIKFIRNYDLL